MTNMQQFTYINHLKKAEKLTYKQLGKVIDMSADAFRMAIKRNSLSKLQLREIKRLFDPNDENYVNENLTNEYITKKKFEHFSKKGVTINLDEILKFIIENEAYIMKNNKLFKLWISEKVYKEMSKKID